MNPLLKDYLAGLRSNIEVILFFLFPIFFLTIKSWSNTIFLLICIVCLCRICKNPSRYYLNKSFVFWSLGLVLIIPFLAELILYFVRDNSDIRYLDSPCRYLGAFFIFSCQSNLSNVDKLVKSFLCGCVLCLVVTFASVTYTTSGYWGARLATYFVDPNMIAVYAVFIFSISVIYINNIDINYYLEKFLHVTTLFCVLYIILFSQTRTSWISFIIVVILFIFINKNKIFYLSFYSLPLLSSAIFLSSFDDSIILNRINMGINSFFSYFEGDNLDTSLGIRFNMILIDLYSIKETPFWGTVKEDIQNLTKINEVFPSVTELSHHCRQYSGSHVELLAVLVRQGVILGLLTIFSLFIFPIFIFFRGAFFEDSSSWYYKCSLIAVVCLLISSFGIQVFAYRMNVSFWALFLSLYFSLYYRNKHVVSIR